MGNGQVNGLISPILERVRLKNIARHVKCPKVLDVGCGRCALKEYLSNIEYHGLEKDKSIDRPADAAISYCDAERDLSKLGKYDSIVMCEIIEHFSNPAEVSKNLKEHLNKG